MKLGCWFSQRIHSTRMLFTALEPFENGQPTGKPVDVLTGFLSDDEDAYGRPVGVIFDATGSLLVADDVGNAIWRVTAEGGQ